MGFIKKTIQYTLLMLMGIQIVLGVVYIVMSMGTMPLFSESRTLLLLSRHLVSDGYTGILYILLLALFSSVPTFVFFIQLLCGALSSWYFIGVWIHHKWIRGWISGFLLTVPFLLQMHMAVLPWSLALSAVLLFLGGLLRQPLQQGDCSWDRNSKFAMLCGYLAAGLIRVELFPLCGIFALALVFWKTKGADRWKTCILIGIVSVTIFTLNRCTYEPQEDRIENSFSASMVSRFVWPNFATNYYFWSDQVKEVMSMEDAVYICQREDALESFFGPKMEAAYGEKEAKRLYMEMAVQCLQDRTKEQLMEIMRDFRDYLLIPFTVEGNMQARGTSLTAWNYGRIQQQAPLLARYYVNYSLKLLPIMLLVSTLSLIRTQHFRRMKEGILFAIWYALWFTLSGNKPIDYKLVLPIILIWYFLSTAAFFESQKSA